MKNQQLIETIKTIALVLIAINLLYSNIHHRDRQTAAVAVDSRVVEVMGRASVAFGGYGAKPGFLIKDGDEFGFVNYDRGSMADQPELKPEYLRIIKQVDGNLTLDSLVIERFNHR